MIRGRAIFLHCPFVGVLTVTAWRISINRYKAGLRLVAERLFDALLLLRLIAHLLHGAHLVQRLAALRLLIVDHVAFVVKVLVHDQIDQIAEVVRLDVASDVKENEVLADARGEHLHFLAVGGRRQFAEASVSQERHENVHDTHHQHNAGDDEEKCKPEPENYEDLFVDDVYFGGGREKRD